MIHPVETMNLCQLATHLSCKCVANTAKTTKKKKKVTFGNESPSLTVSNRTIGLFKMSLLRYFPGKHASTRGRVSSGGDKAGSPPQCARPYRTWPL